MDVDTSPKLLHTSRGDLGRLRAHGDPGRSPAMLHMRRKDWNGWQMKSSLTEHNAMP